MRLAQEGADVIIHHRSSTVNAQSAVAEIERLGRRSCAIAADLTSGCEIKRLFDEQDFRAFGPYSYDLNRLIAWKRMQHDKALRQAAASEQRPAS